MIRDVSNSKEEKGSNRYHSSRRAYPFFKTIALNSTKSAITKPLAETFSGFRDVIIEKLY
jgi:hypothetical protein